MPHGDRSDRPEEDAFFDYVDELVQGQAAPPQTDLEQTALDVQAAAEDDDLVSMPQRYDKWEHIMHTVPQPAVGRSTPYPIQRKRPSKLYRFSPVLNGALAAMVIMALTFGIWRGSSDWVGGNDPKQRLPALNAQDSTPDATPSDVGIVMAAPQEFPAEYCDIPPRTREEMLDILSEIGTVLSTSQTVYPLSTPTGLVEDPGPGWGAPITQQTFDQLQATVNQWHTCETFFLTWQMVALESPHRLRERVYKLPNGLPSQQPYSETTLNEILDNWEATDTLMREEQTAAGGARTEVAYIINPVGLEFYEGSMMTMAVANNGYLIAVQDGTIISDQISMSFFLEDGVWRLDSIYEASDE